MSEEASWDEGRPGFSTPEERACIETVITAVATADRIINHAHAARRVALAWAGQIALLQHERQVASGGGTHDWPHRAIAEEIAAATSTSGRTIERHMNDAANIISRFPAVQERMALGLLSPAHAAVIVAAGDHLEDADARDRYTDAVLERLARHPMTAGALKEVARKIAGEHQPEPIETRHARARRRRTVTFEAGEDGMGWLYAYLPNILGAGIADRLGVMAKEVKAARHADGPDLYADDDRTLAQLRADIFCDLLLAAAPVADPKTTAAGLGAIRASVHITIPVRALVAASCGNGAAGSENAELAGCGPIPLMDARELAAIASVWERMFTDADTGVLLTVDQRFPTLAQRRFLKARDEHCRFPGCRQPVRKHFVDVDHTYPHSRGGPTRIDNLEYLCETHHVLEQFSGWRVVQHPGGVLTWTSPNGHEYTDTPAPVLRFTPPDSEAGRESEPGPVSGVTPGSDADPGPPPF